MTLDEAEKLGNKAREAVMSYVGRAISSLSPRFSTIESRLADLEARLAVLERTREKSSARGKR